MSVSESKSPSGDGSVFERLAARAREMEARRAEEAAAAAAAAAPPRSRAPAHPAGRRVGAGSGGSGESGGTSARLRRVSSASAGSASKWDGDGKEGGSDDDGVMPALPNRGAPGGTNTSGGSARALGLPAGGSSRPSSGEADSSFGLGKPRTGSAKYGGTSASELRATAREQVKSPPSVASKAAAAAAPAPAPAAPTAAALSADEVRARRTAFYESLRRGGGTTAAPAPAPAAGAGTSGSAPTSPTRGGGGAQTLVPLRGGSTASDDGDRPSLLAGTGLRDSDVSPLYGARPSAGAYDAELSEDLLRAMVRARGGGGGSGVAASSARPGVLSPSAPGAGGGGGITTRTSTERAAATTVGDMLARTAPGLASILNRLEAWHEAPEPGGAPVGVATRQLQTGRPAASGTRLAVAAPVSDHAFTPSPDVVLDFSPSTGRRRGAQAAPSLAPSSTGMMLPSGRVADGTKSPSSEPGTALARNVARADAATRPPLRPREIFVDNTAAPSAVALPGTTMATRAPGTGFGAGGGGGGGGGAASGRKAASAKAAALAAALGEPHEPFQLGVGGFAVGPGAAVRYGSGGEGAGGGGAGGGGGGGLPRTGSFRGAEEDTAARDARIQMRDMQRALRIAAHKEEEQRRAREAAEAVGAPAAPVSSLALAAAAYGVPVASKRGTGSRR